LSIYHKALKTQTKYKKNNYKK